MMTKIFTTILIFMVCGNYLAQTNYIALITDPQIGPDLNAEKLINVVDDINKRDSISYVVVIGNLTANGKFDEFLWVQDILDGLTAPYNVIGGKKDYTLSEGKGNEISLLWGDDKFYHLVNGVAFIGLNIFKPIHNTNGYYDIETRNWLHQKMKDHLKGQIFLFGFPTFLQPISNWDDMIKYTAIPRNKNFLNFTNIVTIDEVESLKKTRMPYIYVSKSFRSQEGWKYFLIKIKKRGLSKLELTKSKAGIEVQEEVLDILDRLPIRSIPTYGKKELIKSYSELWEIKLEKSVATKPAIVNDNIYFTSKYGSVLCIENGMEKWKYETDGTIYSSLKVERDLVVVVTNEGDLFTINKNTGNLFQVIGIGETITSDIALVDIEYNGMQTKGICFGTAEGNFYCYELYSLELIWWNQIAKDWINSSVATDKGKVFFQDKKGTMYCLNSQSGVLLWKWKADTKNFNPLFKSDIIIKENNICFVDFDGDLHCIDALLGTKKWSIRKIKASGKIELNEKKNELILHSSKNKILIVSLTKRKITEEFILLGKTKNEIATSIELIGNKLIVGFTNGNVYQLVKKQIPKRILWQGYAPIVSLNKINGNILVTDYDGNLTLLDLSEEKK